MTDDKDKQSGKAADGTGEQESTVMAKIDPIEEKPAAAANSSTSPAEAGILQRIPWIAGLALILVAAVGMMTLQNSQQTSQQAKQLQSMQQKTLQLDQQLLQEKQKFEQLLASIQTRISQDQSQFEKLQLDLSSAQRDRFDLEEKIKQVSLQASAKGRDPLKWRLAEIEYLLSVANQRLILAQDHNTALTALNDADKRLRTIADPGLSQIRLTIANEIKSLQSVQVPDIAGMAMKLSALVNGISQLPLVNRERMMVNEQSGVGQKVDSWRQIPAAIWRDIKGLVTVRRSDLSIEPILPPDELHYLSQNLGLKIEQARLALLRKDTELFRSNLKDTGLWISRYFDHDNASVTNVIDTINVLMASEVVTSMPDISASLRQLRRWRESQASALYLTPTKPRLKKSKLSSIKPQPKVKKPSAATAPKVIVKSRPPAPASEPSKDVPEQAIANVFEAAPLQPVEPGQVDASLLKPESDQGLSSAKTEPQKRDPDMISPNSEADLSTATQTNTDVANSPSGETP